MKRKRTNWEDEDWHPRETAQKIVDEITNAIQRNEKINRIILSEKEADKIELQVNEISRSVESRKILISEMNIMGRPIFRRGYASEK